MVDKASIIDAIQTSPKEAADALLAVQSGETPPISFDALKAVADLLNRKVEEVAADEIERRGLMEAFARALQARGVMFDAEDAGLKETHFDPDGLKTFISRAKAFRCRVLVNRNAAGSGCLISPSLVLTAWHVIARGAPDQPEPPPPPPPVEVLLSDGTRRRAQPKPYFASTSTSAEFAGQLPTEDTAFNGFNDVALIKLDRPDGARLGFAPLPPLSQTARSRSSIVLLHFPQGNDPGFGFGKLSKYRGITARWQHDVQTAAGSSGGPCFDTHFSLAGLHQGKWPPNGRLIPLARFFADIRPLIERDVAPSVLWSLDGTTGGPLVVGRDLFFEAVAASARPTSRVRGVRVKRRDVSQGTTGLAFSLEMLMQLLARNPGAHRTIRINFEPPYGDLINEIRRRARIAGLDIPEIEASAGTRAGETTLEATANERARSLVAQLNLAAERDGRLLWCLFDNPPVGLTDAERFAFEAFVGAALKQPQLRLVLAGFETIPTPGEEFANAGMADEEGSPGLVVEYFGVFNRGDVEQLLTRACQDFGVPVDAAVIADRTNQILQGLNHVNGQYSVAELRTLSERAVEHLEHFRKLAEPPP
jgi:V8-like Glu-specific endopeptidase